jgi:glycosyltransferase involved in cell wall biosynthesis
MLITVFTPTYNRAYIIPKLYESLLNQTNKNFEWIVVDDGSTDDTKELFDEYLLNKEFTIKYIKTENGGKQKAINKGVSVAKGELFFIVDSDDYLTEDALSNISNNWEVIEKKNRIAGFCFRKVNYNTNKIIGGHCHLQSGDYSSIEIAYELGILGDKAEVFKTSVLKLYPFPEFVNENFVPEALVWFRISNHFKLRFINTGIYMCEYLPDGLSKNFNKNLQKNSTGFALFYKEVLFYKRIPFFIKLKSFLRYLQCTYYTFKKIM